MKRLSFCTLLVCLCVSQTGWGQNSLTIGQGSAPSGEVADIPLSLSTDADAQGFIMALQWDGAAATATALVVNDAAGEPLATAGLVVSRVEGSLIVLSVVMDVDGMGGEAIAAGQDITVATAQIRCDGAAANEVALNFVDGALATIDGGPTLDNTLVQGGLSITAAEGLVLNNGTLTCEGGGVPEDCAAAGDEDGDGLENCDDPDCATDPLCEMVTPEDCAAAGDEDGDGLENCDDPDCATDPACEMVTPEDCATPGDEDGDGLADCADPDCAGTDECPPEPAADAAFACGGPLGDDGLPTKQTMSSNGTATVNFYYRSNQPLQGLSMAIRHSCKLSQVDGSTNREGGALDAANAEFVSIEIDDTSDDGDICEIVVGVLVDFQAPFDGHKLPASNSFEKLFSHDFQDVGGSCNECLFLGYIGRADVPGGREVGNLVSIDFQSQRVDTSNCSLCIEGDPFFRRGNCNMSSGGTLSVDIADAAAQVGHVFLDGNNGYDAPCEDACDANDDGLLDAADVVFLLQFLFTPNSPDLPAPFSNTGPDTTDDALGCVGGNIRC